MKRLLMNVEVVLVAFEGENIEKHNLAEALKPNASAITVELDRILYFAETKFVVGC
ncbi:MAG: hypothetical protein ABI954_15380 [Pyrinomonadaceae bacterium]